MADPVVGLRGEGAGSELRVRDLGGYLRPGVVWINDHTGDETTITEFATRTERVPDPAGGFKDDHQIVVHHTTNVPPGFDKGYGDDLRSFLAHWQPKEIRRRV